MEAFLITAGVIALGEMGDKTQLLAVLLTARFRAPVPIILGIVVATVVNHASAALLGGWIATALGPHTLRWLIGGSFLAMALWMLVPDRMDDAPSTPQRWGVFGTTVLAFFLAEMGDKTQIATIALAARFHDTIGVVAGSTAGILIADVPAVLLGGALVRKYSMRWLHRANALVFALLGLAALFNADTWF